VSSQEDAERDSGDEDESLEPRRIDARSGHGQQIGESNVQLNWFGPPGPSALGEACKRLSSGNISEHLAGIHTLAVIVKDSKKDRASVARILCAFVLERARWRRVPWPATSSTWRLVRLRDFPDLATRAADVQAALTLLGSRQLGSDAEPLVLPMVDLRNADLRNSHFQKANFRGANLNGAKLVHADLSHADLSRADISYADLTYANLTRADLGSATLDGTGLTGADLSGAMLHHTRMIGCSLVMANLSGASLLYANLYKTSLSGADLSGAQFGGAKLMHAVALTETQLHSARGDSYTRLPPELSRPRSWPKSAIFG
jgi:uncharacterized protein YjbI with pentapeptide repeats